MFFLFIEIDALLSVGFFGCRLGVLDVPLFCQNYKQHIERWMRNGSIYFFIQ